MSWWGWENRVMSNKWWPGWRSCMNQGNELLWKLTLSPGLLNKLKACHKGHLEEVGQNFGQLWSVNTGSLLSTFKCCNPQQIHLWITDICLKTVPYEWDSQSGLTWKSPTRLEIKSGDSISYQKLWIMTSLNPVTFLYAAVSWNKQRKEIMI